MSCLFAEPDPKGNWKLSGLAVDYLHIARETTPFYLTVDYPNLAGTSFATDSDCGEAGSTSICIFLQDLPAGVMFNRLTNGPFTNTGLGGIGVNLNINVYDNGFGTIAQGSFYPDIELSESQACVTDLQIFSVDENFTWEIGSETTFSDANVLGMPDGLLCGDDDPNTVANECTGDANTDEAWGFGLVTGLFDATPSTPVPVRVPPGLPYVALTDGTVLGYACATALTGSACGDLGWDLANSTFTDLATVTSETTACVIAGGDQATCQATAVADNTSACTDCTTDCITAMGAGAATLGGNIASCEAADYATAGTYFGGAGWLHGTGTSSKFNLNAGNSAMCGDDGWSEGCNPDADFKLVWHAIDGEASGLGFGDDPDVDEDNDGSPFDRIFGVPYISVTKVNTSNPLCDVTGGGGGDAWNYPLAGDIVATLGETAGCDDLSTYNAQYDCGANVVDAFITGNCYSGVVDAIVDQCTTAGGVANTVYGGCVELANEDILDTCNAYVTGAQGQVADACSPYGGPGDAAYDVCYADNVGAAEALAISGVIAGACVSAGGPATVEESNAMNLGGMTCSDIGDAYAVQGGGTCAGAAGLAGLSCTDSSGASLCCLAGNIGAATYATCDDFAASYDYDGLDELFAETTGGVTCASYGDNFVDWCLEDSSGDYNGDNDTEMYLFKPGAGLDTWGDFMTFNAASFSALAGQAAAGPIPCGDAGLVAFPGSHPTGDWDGDGDGPDAGDIAAFTGYCNPHLLVNDFDHDFDETCLYDQDPSDCSGRLRMTFEPTCVPEIEAREIVAEFSDLSALCNHSGDVDYSCSAYDWNYSTLADTDGDGVDAADCEAFATATGQAYVVNNYAVLPSCDADDGITENCTEYSATVVWNAAYNMCGDGDPNDLIYLGPDGFCALAVPTGSFDAASVGACGGPDVVIDAYGTTCAYATCLGYYATVDGGIPSFEQSCTVGNGDVSVTDVVRIINHIIGNDSTGGDSADQLGGEAACEADVNNDGNINVVDVVQIVNGILSSNGRIADATEASISIENDKIVVNADGYIGAVDMIVELTDNSSFDLADSFAGTYSINGNKAHIIVIGDENGVSEVLTMTSGKIIGIEEALVANSSDFVTTSINQPSIFSVGAAYPNPFNPSTNISLVLNANADLSVKIYNLTGQLVDVIAEGNYSPSSYNWTWKAENLASGVYFIKTQVNSEISTQKVMLLK